jgi:hypothetical protein
MRMRTLPLVVLMFGVVACRSDSVPLNPVAEPVRAEFTKRLGAYQGELQLLELGRTGVAAKWTSARCEMLEGEVIDLLISLHRGHPGKVAGPIKAERVCGGETRTFETTAARFEQYRTGQINDVTILSGLR